MTRTRALRILPEAAASGAGGSSWLACTPPVGLALLAVLYAWISAMTVLGDAILTLIKGAAVLLAVAWAAARLRHCFGRGSTPRAVVPDLAILGLGAAGAVWMFPGVWTIPRVPLALPALGIAGTIPAVYSSRPPSHAPAATSRTGGSADSGAALSRHGARAPSIASAA